MSTDAELCRKVWAAIEKYPALRVKQTMVDSLTYRWICAVQVPWEYHCVAVATMADVERLAKRLDDWEAKRRVTVQGEKLQAVDAIVAGSLVVAQYSSGEKQLGLF